MRVKILLVLGLLMLVSFPLANAQEGDSGGAGITIHVVQRNETLSEIAQLYGTTIEALTALNSLADPDRLQAGQRLLIPSSSLGTGGLITTHLVEPGETLFTIARRYNSTPASLSQINSITNTKSLYVGQNIQVTQGANGRLPPSVTSMYIARAGDTLLRVAVRYRIPLVKLAEANQLDIASPLQAGQIIILPDSRQGSRFVNLPAPLRDVQIAPLPAEQGRSVGVYLELDGEASLSGKFLEREVRFARSENAYYAMIGIHAFTETGIYPLTITITLADGAQIVYESRVRVMDGGYSQEAIELPPDKQGLLDPAVVQPELDRVSSIMSGFSQQKYFDGLMNLPSTGPVTSQFGTRRSYNGSPYNTFHGGADFGGAPGSLVTAPADGMVVLAEPLQVRGNAIIIDHGWGVYTGYWHNTETFVTVGQLVKRGDPIGTLGATGLVTGAHLHWEMWVGGVQVDPLQWLTHAFGQFNLEETASLPN